MFVLVAVATEKIANLARHFVAHRKDNQSNRGFQVLLLSSLSIDSLPRFANLDSIVSTTQNDAIPSKERPQGVREGGASARAAEGGQPPRRPTLASFINPQ